MNLADLNDEQRAAVTHGEGPLLVVAAAGSGKTRVLTYRAAHLIREGVRPDRIMLATFTRKAATEMVDRAEHLVGADAEDITAGTLHSLFLRVLRAEGYPWRQFDVLDEYGQKRMVKELVKGRASTADLAEILSQISLWKNELVTPDEAYQLDKATGLIYDAYEDEKASARVLDFDDMLTRAVTLFDRDGDVLDRYRRRTPWVLVDEAQDTSTAQWRLLEMLAGVNGSAPRDRRDDHPANDVLTEANADHSALSSGDGPASVDNADDTGRGGQVGSVSPPGDRPRFGGPPSPVGNLTAVADWRQAIYSWRGARPEFILDFADRFPGTTQVGLPTNYRSTPPIVVAANDLIRHAGRDLEDMVPVRDGGQSPAHDVYETPDVEADAVVGEIQAQFADGREPGDIAILYRVNSYSRAFEDALARANIPYVIVGSLGFFGRREVTDIVSYLRLMTDPRDEDALRRIVNRPTRYLGRAYCDAVVEYARDEECSLREALEPPSLASRQRMNAEDFVGDLDALADELGTRGLVAAIQAIREGIGYDRWLLREEGSGSADEDRLETLTELQSIAGQYASVDKFLTYVAMQRSRSKSRDVHDKVQLMSIHRSKGLEWPVVFVVGVSTDILPHKRCMSGAAFEEERRLAYVAFTRARDDLFVSSILHWQNRDLTPSLFVSEAGMAEPPSAEWADDPVVPGAVTDGESLADQARRLGMRVP